jgi:hypothetical protein
MAENNPRICFLEKPAFLRLRTHAIETAESPDSRNPIAYRRLFGRLSQKRMTGLAMKIVE